MSHQPDESFPTALLSKRAGASLQPELSIVMPCLNEAETIGTCIQKAQAFLRRYEVMGEIVVADNGSTDGSQEIAKLMGARVIPVEAKGYGNALMGGITAARGRYVIMGDADDSYDFLDFEHFMDKLREGHDLVHGMQTSLGRWDGQAWGDAVSAPLVGQSDVHIMARQWFGAPINDVYCGLRGFSKALIHRLNLRCTGMEFATEMIIKSASIPREDR